MLIYICSLQECTLSPPSFTPYQILPHYRHGHFHCSRLGTVTPIDYANSLNKYRVSTRNIHKLQRCQNTAARLILQQSFTPSIQDLMNSFTGSQSRPGLISKLPQGSFIWSTSIPSGINLPVQTFAPTAIQ